MTWRTTRPDPVAGDGRLSVPGAESVRRAPEERDADRDQDEADGQLALAHECLEAARRG